MYLVGQSVFSDVPGSPFCYWAGPRLRRVFKEMPTFADFGARPTLGLVTADNDRFIRLRWEVPEHSRVERWVDYCKGGDYSKYYDDPHLLVDWRGDGTRFFSVQVGGVQSQSSLFGFEPPKVRIEVRANKNCVSMPVSASYGFEDATGEVKLKIAERDQKRLETNTITVMIAEEITQKTVGIYLLDATTGAELAAPLTIEVAISM
jgi:hypothetical protein